jgi:hypothetical protein
MRLDLDVRRRWRCPACGAERKTAGDVTSVACQCSAEAPLMHFVEVSRLRRPEPKPYDPYVDADFEDLSDEPCVEQESLSGDVTDSGAVSVHQAATAGPASDEHHAGGFTPDDFPADSSCGDSSLAEPDPPPSDSGS